MVPERAAILAGISFLLFLLALPGGRAEAGQQTSAEQEEAPAAAATSSSEGASVAPALSATDSEEPPAPAHRPGPFPLSPRKRQSSTDDDDPYEGGAKGRNPEWGFMLEVGLGAGGDNLIEFRLSDGSRDTLSAGDGMTSSLGFMWTPLWLGDSLGIGASGTVGYKWWSVNAQNASVTLSRYPFTAALHLLPRLAPRWLLLVRGGIDKEANVSVSGTGATSGPEVALHANLGGFAEVGFYYIMNIPEQQAAWSLTIRYTKLTYTANGGAANAQSFGVFSTFYLNP